MALIYAMTGQGLLGAPLLLAAAVGGFLCWNFPPARIFMAMWAVAFLGLILGMLSLQAALIELSLFWAWMILLGVFVVDATWTLLRRLSRGKKPTRTIAPTPTSGPRAAWRPSAGDPGGAGHQPVLVAAYRFAGGAGAFKCHTGALACLWALALPGPPIPCWVDEVAMAAQSPTGFRIRTLTCCVTIWSS